MVKFVKEMFFLVKILAYIAKGGREHTMYHYVSHNYRGEDIMMNADT